MKLSGCEDTRWLHRRYAPASDRLQSESAIDIVGIGDRLRLESVIDITGIHIKTGYVFGILFVFSNIAVTTMLGLHYMSERINRYEPKKKKISKPHPVFLDTNLG